MQKATDTPARSILRMTDFRAKGKARRPLTNNPPYGDMKDAEDKNRWIIDEEAAVVRRIFAMTVSIGPYRIAKILSDEKVEKPSYYQAVRGRGCYKNQCDFMRDIEFRNRLYISR